MDPAYLHGLGILAALGSSAAWALGALLFRRLGRDISPLPLTLGKSLIGIVLLSAALACTGWTALSPRELGWLALSGVIGIAVGDACFFAALRDLEAHALVALMLLCPVLTLFLAVAFLHERPSGPVWAGIALTLAGIGLVMQAESGAPGAPSRLRGVLFGLASVVCTSVATIISAAVLKRVPALDAAWVRMIAGCLGLALFGLATGQGRAWAGELRRLDLGLRLLAATAIVTFGGFWLSLVALRFATVAIANTLNSLEALFILPMAALWLREKPRPPAIAGALVGCAGVAVILAASRQG